MHDPSIDTGMPTIGAAYIVFIFILINVALLKKPDPHLDLQLLRLFCGDLRYQSILYDDFVIFKGI